jgi:hypothetical protein
VNDPTFHRAAREEAHQAYVRAARAAAARRLDELDSAVKSGVMTAGQALAYAFIAGQEFQRVLGEAPR